MQKITCWIIACVIFVYSAIPIYALPASNDSCCHDVHISITRTSYQRHFDDLPDDERDMILAFIAEHGGELVSPYITNEVRIQINAESYDKIISCEYDDCCNQLFENFSARWFWTTCTSFIGHNWQRWGVTTSGWVEHHSNCGAFWFTGPWV